MRTRERTCCIKRLLEEPKDRNERPARTTYRNRGFHGSIPFFLGHGDRRRGMKVLKNARLIDGTGASPVNSATIVIDGNRIKEVTARSLGDFPADAEVIDVAGMTVLPGLI